MYVSYSAYLTGFSKRKKERKEAGRKFYEERQRKQRVEERKEAREALKKEEEEFKNAIQLANKVKIDGVSAIDNEFDNNIHHSKVVPHKEKVLTFNGSFHGDKKSTIKISVTDFNPMITPDAILKRLEQSKRDASKGIFAAKAFLEK